MPNFIIKTHKSGNQYSGSHIFILNKGMNSGKPQKEPFTNSFVILFPNEEDSETVYWLAYSLWNFFPKVDEMLLDFENHQKDVKALRLLELKEKQFHQNIHLINDLRRVIVHRYCKK
jgi:hypothetical protein